MTQYRHRQYGTIIIIALGSAAIVFVLLANLSSVGYIGWIAATILVTAGILFSSLTIQVSDEFLRWEFGPGLIRKSVLLSDIAEIEMTQTKFL